MNEKRLQQVRRDQVDIKKKKTKNFLIYLSQFPVESSLFSLKCKTQSCLNYIVIPVILLVSQVHAGS